MRFGTAHPGRLRRAVSGGRPADNLVHGAHIVAEHGVGELWTTDRDFARFPEVRARDPFASPLV